MFCIEHVWIALLVYGRVVLVCSTDLCVAFNVYTLYFALSVTSPVNYSCVFTFAILTIRRCCLHRTAAAVLPCSTILFPLNCNTVRGGCFHRYLRLATNTFCHDKPIHRKACWLSCYSQLHHHAYVKHCSTDEVCRCHYSATRLMLRTVHLVSTVCSHSRYTDEGIIDDIERLLHATSRVQQSEIRYHGPRHRQFDRFIHV